MSDWNTRANKPAEVDLDALKREVDEHLRYGKFYPEPCPFEFAEGVTWVIDYLYRKGHLAAISAQRTGDKPISPDGEYGLALKDLDKAYVHDDDPEYLIWMLKRSTAATIRAALTAHLATGKGGGEPAARAQPPVDVEALKRECTDKLVGGTSNDYSIASTSRLLCLKIEGTIDYLVSKGYLK